MNPIEIVKQGEYGKPWRDEELDAIISDYFDMLTAELAGKPYIKSKHSSALMAQIGRSHRSVEFKHQNISAVLEELGLPWIPGYKPKSNYQNSIFGAVDRFLSRHPAIFEVVPSFTKPIPKFGDVFVKPPLAGQRPKEIPEGLRRLARKFDPVERDHRNRALGRAGEEFVLKIERMQLEQLGLRDLARRVRWVSAEEGDGAGYDILSFSPWGPERLIEVKTTNGGPKTPFFLSRNEYGLAAQRPSDWRIYRVHLFASTPRIFEVAPPLEKAAILRPETWRASF